jgi:hypothetical protein
MITQNTWLHTAQTDTTWSKWATQRSQKKGILLRVFLRMLSTAHITQHSIIGGQLINELETMWNQAVIA